ncbi:MAG TPA: hypothetical protein VFA75_09315 [Nevskia sp.]|nr:hypothetical protein [Nevskia sp.]
MLTPITRDAGTAASRSRMPLATWLRVLAGRGDSELLLGGTGHLLLSPEEEHNVARQLRGGVLPRLFPEGGFAQVCLLTGLAPGADLLLARVLSGWLLERDIPFRMVGLLPVPPENLLEDWLDSLPEVDETHAAGQRQQRREQIEGTLASCETIVDLMPPGSGDADLANQAFRERQYRLLAACLAQRSDILIAILRQQNLLRPGGTAEVVDWRRNPLHIPAEFCTDPPPPPDGAGHRLIVIDPAVDYTAAGDGG